MRETLTLLIDAVIGFAFAFAITALAEHFGWRDRVTMSILFALVMPYIAVVRMHITFVHGEPLPPRG